MPRFRFSSDTNRQQFEADLDALDVPYQTDGPHVLVPDPDDPDEVRFVAESWNGLEDDR